MVDIVVVKVGDNYRLHIPDCTILNKCDVLWGVAIGVKNYEDFESLLDRLVEGRKFKESIIVKFCDKCNVELKNGIIDDDS